MRRATSEDADRINEWIWRDNGARLPHLAEWLSDRLNVCLIEGEGGALFVWRGPGVYEAHCFFEQRGKAVFELSRRMLEYMREHGARMFWSAAPTESRHVIMYLRLLGWKSQGFAILPQGRCEIFSGE